MRILLDENLSPILRDLLVNAGHDVVHVRDLELVSAPDEVVMDRAAAENRVLISADTDFGTLLAGQQQPCRPLY
jgi:predicted nuclease of predicted toxin-antitoxin system